MKYIETCELLTCGTEILMGQIVNTNAAYLARKLPLLGISSQYQTTVGDNPERLDAALRTALGRSDCVIMTGGLGPTEDDISMAAAARVSGRAMVCHEPSAAAIRAYFDRLGRRVTDNNFKQALIPEGATVLPNHNGTAPGAIVPVGDEPEARYIILLPGPPMENHMMFERYVEPFFMAHANAQLHSSFVRLIGIGESEAETRLKDLIERQKNPTIAPYCSEGEVMFRVTQRTASGETADAMAPILDEIRSRLGQYIYEIGDRPLPVVVKDMLAERHLTVSFAESCTAGLVSATFGDLPGVSAVMRGGIVSYSNDVKHQVLAVPAETLERFGAVSEETARAMAEGCRRVTGADLSVSITGVAGPGGGSDEKPVGLVYIAVADAVGCAARRFLFTGSRNKIRRIATLNAFNLLRVRLLETAEQPAFQTTGGGAAGL